VAFLGHAVLRKGIEIDPQEIEAIKQWLRPILVIEIRSFFEVYKELFLYLCTTNRVNTEEC
jgi:hypothetical protein